MNQYDDFEVKEIVEQEGLEYAVRHYMGVECIKSPETQKLWVAAEEALNALARRLHLDDA